MPEDRTKQNTFVQTKVAKVIVNEGNITQNDRSNLVFHPAPWGIVSGYLVKVQNGAEFYETAFVAGGPDPKYKSELEYAIMVKEWANTALQGDTLDVNGYYTENRPRQPPDLNQSLNVSS
jgi:hypothetical protein